MLRILPYRYKTLILPITSEDVSYLLKSVTETPKDRPFYDQKDKIKGLIKFKGLIKEKHFSISKKTSYYQPFIPLIVGDIEATNENTLVQLQFKPFPQTEFMIAFWSIASILIGIFLIVHHKTNFAGTSFVLGFLNYAIAFANFKIHSKDALENLTQTLSWE